MDMKILLIFIGVLFVLINVITVAKRKNRINLQQKQLIKYLDRIIHNVLIEKHNGIEYWFDADKHSFLAQGKTIDEILTVIKSRFPDHVFLLKEQGAFCAKTNWELTDFDRLKTLNFIHKEGI